MEKRNELPRIVTSPGDWKHQFHQVKVIGPEPAMNAEGFWKKPLTPKVKFSDDMDQPHDRSDR